MGEHSKIPDSRWDLVRVYIPMPLRTDSERVRVAHWSGLGIIAAGILVVFALSIYLVITWLAR